MHFGWRLVLVGDPVVEVPLHVWQAHGMESWNFLQLYRASAFFVRLPNLDSIVFMQVDVRTGDWNWFGLYLFTVGFLIYNDLAEHVHCPFMSIPSFHSTNLFKWYHDVSCIVMYYVVTMLTSHEIATVSPHNQRVAFSRLTMAMSNSLKWDLLWKQVLPKWSKVFGVCYAWQPRVFPTHMECLMQSVKLTAPGSNLLLGVCATELPLFAQWLCRSLVLCSLAPNHSCHPVLLIYWCRNVWRISSSDSVAELMRALKLNPLKGILLWITGETRLEAAYRLSLSEPWSCWFFEERKDPTR